VCKLYKPRFGQGVSAGLQLQQFQNLYANDVFYHWFGLDSSLVYSAHRAAGGMTSIYRQIGISVEELFRQILRDHLNLNAQQTIWSYQVKISERQTLQLKLDGRIDLTDLGVADQQRVQAWIASATLTLGITPDIAQHLKGAVFEVRQGYKSKDSKRQNADIANASAAYVQGYLPVVVLFSNQIDQDVALRYTNARWLVLRGTLHDDPAVSVYAFMRDIVGYDLALFFERNTIYLREFTEAVLQVLLSNDE
jgi:hypothetical protein